MASKKTFPSLNQTSPEWIYSWQRPPGGWFAWFGNPETEAVRCCGSNVYFASQKGLCYASLPQLNPGESKIDLALAKNWDFGAVSTIDSYERLLVCGLRSSDNNVLIYDTQSSQSIRVFSHTGEQQPVTQSWQAVFVSNVKWANSGNWIFSSSPGRGFGVQLWDVEQATNICSFDHRKDWNGKREVALYGSRDPHEIYGLCPTRDGQLVVSGSYRYIYVWDTRTPDSWVHREEFYPPIDREPKDDELWGNQQSTYPLNCIGFIDPNESKLTVVGKRLSKVITYEFPSMKPMQELDPDFKDFLLPGELTDVYFSPYNTVAVDVYGSTYLWSNQQRQGYMRIESDLNIGSGPNGVCMNPTEDVIALSMSNPQSGWCGGAATIYCKNLDLVGSENVIGSSKKSARGKSCVAQ